MDESAIAYARALRERDAAEWRRHYVPALDGVCAACAAGQPVFYRYVSYWGVACHVHTAPAWVPLPAPAPLSSYGRSVL